MKNITAVFLIFIVCVFSSNAQVPAETPKSAALELSNLQTDYDPQSGTSPLILLRAPKDAVAYYEMKQRAKRLYEARKFAEAEPLLDRLVRDYPRDPENWRMLADTKVSLKKPLEAVPAYEQVGKLIGWDLEFWGGYEVAESYLAAGNKRAALDMLRHMIFERRGFVRTALYDDPDYADLRDNPEFLELIGRPDTTGWSRDKGWTYDLDFLYSELKRVNPDYRDKPFPAELERRYRELKNRIPQLSDAEIFVGMGRMLAVLCQGHVAIFNPPNDRHLPVLFYIFPDGIYIIDADNDYKNLIGSRVVAIGDTPAEEALRQMAEAQSVDGNMQYVWGTSRMLASAYYLKGIKAIKSLNSVPINNTARRRKPSYRNSYDINSFIVTADGQNGCAS